MLLRTLTEELIAIPSVTGEEAAVLAYIETVLEDMGLSCTREHVAENRWNLYAGWDAAVGAQDAVGGLDGSGRKDDPLVVFCTHVDTVPPFIPFSSDEQYLYGRGACDTKGIIAAMIVAGSRLLADGHHPAFLFVVGEETDSIGAKIAGESGRKADYVIVGEPTENSLASGHKGSLGYTLETTGKAAHSAYPELGESALENLLQIIREIQQRDWGFSDVLGTATTNIGTLKGGLAANILAPSATASILHRIVDDATRRKQEVIEVVSGRAEITFHSVSDPQFLHTVPGFETTAVSFGTDIPYLRPMGSMLLFGPGSIHDAHTLRERISRSEQEKAVSLYVSLYQQLQASLT